MALLDRPAESENGRSTATNSAAVGKSVNMNMIGKRAQNIHAP